MRSLSAAELDVSDRRKLSQFNPIDPIEPGTPTVGPAVVPNFDPNFEDPYGGGDDPDDGLLIPEELVSYIVRLLSVILGVGLGGDQFPAPSALYSPPSA